MKQKMIGFCWQHLLLIISLWIMTFGVAVCVRSMLGCSTISVLPYVFENAGVKGLVPAFTIGQYTYAMNGIFVLLQFLILRKQFDWVQLFQLVIGFLFGYLLDVNMAITSWILPTAIWQKVIAQILGCTILGTGIALEVRCGSVTMPGEGLPVALSRVLKKEFPKIKICVDTTLVVLSVIASFIFFHAWQWHIVGIGTLFAMFYVGIVVKFVSKHLRWFDCVLAYRPGFRRYIFGLAKLIYRKK